MTTNWIGSVIDWTKFQIDKKGKEDKKSANFRENKIKIIKTIS